MPPAFEASGFNHHHIKDALLKIAQLFSSAVVIASS
jgi:hypothetical protein